MANYNYLKYTSSHSVGRENDNGKGCRLQIYAAAISVTLIAENTSPPPPSLRHFIDSLAEVFASSPITYTLTARALYFGTFFLLKGKKKKKYSGCAWRTVRTKGDVIYQF